MEKDLRDAYKALSLLRADLVATRKAKSELEDQWRASVAHQRAQDTQRGAQLAQIRETFLMREEDFHAQLVHSTAAHSEQQQQAVVKNAMLQHELTQSRETTVRMTKNDSENVEDGAPQPEEEDNQKHHEPQTTLQGVHEAQKQVEAITKEKVELLASVFVLKQQVQAQADQLVQQDVVITQERNEWGLQCEDMKREIAVLHEAKRDFEREMKFSEEKFEFLRAEVDVVKAERDALNQHVQLQEEKAQEAIKIDNEGVEPSLEEPETVTRVREEMKEMHEKQVAEIAEAHAAELTGQKKRMEELELEIMRLKGAEALSLDELKAIHAETVEKLTTQFEEEIQKLRDELKMVKEGTTQQGERTQAQQEELQKKEDTMKVEVLTLTNERAELMQQLESVRAEAQEQLRSHAKQEEARMKTQLGEREKLQQELTTLLTSFEDATAENAVKMESLRTTNETLQCALSEKSRAMAETQGRVTSARQQLSRTQQVVALQREGLDQYREDALEQRRLVIGMQQQLKQNLQRLEEELLARFEVEKNALEQQSGLQTSAFEEKLASWDVARASLEAELRASADVTQALKQQLHGAEAARAFLQQQVETSGARIVELEAEVEAKEVELVKLRSLTEKEHDVRGQEIDTLRTLHHKTTTERNAVADELHKLKVEYERLETEAAEGRTARFELRKLQDQYGGLESQVCGLEQQLMAAEDQANDRGRAAASPTSSSWSELATQIRSLDDFLSQLQLFAGRLQTCFLLCEENPRAMRILSTSSSPSLLTDLVTLLQLVDGWRHLFEVKGLALHVRLIRRSVLATLAQWFEEGEENTDASSPPPPPPPFGIESQEVAIILQNWTHDLDKRQSVSAWLKRIATATKAVVDSDSPRDEDAGTTLELKDMTREVKDAFCMLIVPLLKQNRNVFVRVFTRRVCDVKSSYSPDETSWQMRIHVQFPQQHRRIETPSQLRRVSSSSSISSVASSVSVSSVASSLSLSSISSASKLQMIQVRLQQMQQQHH